jgi:CDGSH-type Zn-finger protein
LRSSRRVDIATALALQDSPPLCAFARICDGRGRVWSSVLEAEDQASREVIAHQTSYCPSERLIARDRAAGGAPLEPTFELSIVLIEDPQKQASGPIWVRGGAAIVAADGTEYERRNRATLCRCGQSSNKPFCDGTHAHIGFRAHADAD